MAVRIILSSSANNTQRGSLIKPRAEPIPRLLQVAAISSPYCEKSSVGFGCGHGSVASSLKVGVGGARPNRRPRLVPTVRVSGGSDDPLLRSSSVAEYEENGAGERTIRTAIGTPGSEASQKHASDGQRSVSSFGLCRCKDSQGTEYDIFLSFRGDLRHGFVDFLYDSLLGARLHVFFDEKNLGGGEIIDDALIRAIGRSKILMPIFSKNYATSKSCLMELVEMVKCWRSSNRQRKIRPICFDVTPYDVSDVSDVKEDDGTPSVKGDKRPYRPYSEALRHHIQEGVDWEIVKEWKEALEALSKLEEWWELEKKEDGYDPGHQGQFAKLISRKVSEILKLSQLDIPGHFVMLDDKVEVMMRRLEVGSVDELRCLILYGIPGVGRTTFAKYIYNSVHTKFDCYVYLANVSKERPESLQNKLVSRLSNLDENSPKWLGTEAIQRRFSAKKALIILDGVDKENQLKELVGEGSCFGPGSRIIIITRKKDILKNKDTLKSFKVCSYELSEMGYDESFSLYSKLLFEGENPPCEYVEILEKLVMISGGLPSAIESFASHLLHKPKEKWGSELKIVEETPFKFLKKEIQEEFTTMIKDLRGLQEQIFLDIAFFLIGVDIRIAIHMWDAQCNPREAAIEELIKKLLIKIRNDKKLWMNGLIRDTARQLVVHSGNVGRWCNHEEALKLLEKNKGTEAAEALVLHFDSAFPSCLTPVEFRYLQNLRYLRLNGGKLAGSFQGLLPKLRWLKWHCCPQEVFPKYLDLPSLAVLDLSWSMMSEAWDGWRLFKTAGELKVMILVGCSKLTRTPDFSAFRALERMILEHCEELIEFHKSVGRLERLVYLNLRGCTSIKKLPEELFSLKTLEELVLDNTQITQLPDSIESLSELRVLSLRGCGHLSKLPESIGKLEFLEVLDLSDTGITELPASIRNRKCLKVLGLDVNSTTVYPVALRSHSMG